MKTLISLFALFLSLTLTAQANSATWYLNNTSGNGIQSLNNAASGTRSIAMGSLSTAIGSYSTAMGYNSEASGLMSTAMGSDTTASGDYSTATGRNTQAIGNFSTTMGYKSEASGSASIAMGWYTTASGSSSTAMGYLTKASGKYSTAIGRETTASDRSSLVIGQYNLLGSTVTNSATQFSTDNTALVIGNGADSDNRSDALVVKFNGDATLAGSMTATSFIGDGSQLTNLPSSGSDSPFSYNSNEAGGIEIADYTTASGSRAFAVGNDNLASGISSTAMGRGTIASGDDSTALGANTEASGIGSTAMGGYTTASGSRSTAMGLSTTASGDYSTAMGESTLASGSRSTAMGEETRASDYTSLVVGKHNLAGYTVTASATEYSLDNTAFVIGNGSSWDNRSDALVVKFNGDATLAGNLNINSDARLKSNIISLGSTLSKLLQIDGKSYTMKKDDSEKQKIGLLAQDIEKVFPELVSESHGVKSVNYQGLVPVLINALKEQDAMMKEQDNRLSKQQSEIDRLKNQEKRLERLERLVAAMD